MKKLTTLAELNEFVLRPKAIIFCSATWVSWLSNYRHELISLPIAEIDVDDPVFVTIIMEKSVSNVPAFLLYSNGSYEKTLVGKRNVEELARFV